MAKGVGDVSKVDQGNQEAKVSLRALVASDCPTIRQRLQVMMDESGYRVTDVGGGLEALHVAQLTEPFDIILVDASTSILNGIETVVQIRSLFGRKGSAPIVAVVEECAQNDVVRLLEAGFDEVFQAPIVRDNLLNKCKQVIMHHVSAQLDGVAEYTSGQRSSAWGQSGYALAGV